MAKPLSIDYSAFTNENKVEMKGVNSEEITLNLNLVNKERHKLKLKTAEIKKIEGNAPISPAIMKPQSNSLSKIIY